MLDTINRYAPGGVAGEGGEQVIKSHFAARVCAVVIGAAAMAAPALAQDTARQFGQSPAGRQFGDQLAPGPDQTPAAAATAKGAKKTAAKPDATVKGAKKTAAKKVATAKPGASSHHSSVDAKAATTRAAGKAKVPATPVVAAQAAPLAPAARPGAAPAPVLAKANPAAPAGAQSRALYAIGGLLAALLAILAGVFAFRGMRRRTDAVAGGDIGPAMTSGAVAAGLGVRAFAEPSPAPAPRVSPVIEPALVVETPPDAAPEPASRVSPMIKPALEVETPPPVAKGAAAPPKPRARKLAKTDSAPEPSPAASPARKRAVAKPTAQAPVAAAPEPDLTPKAAAKPAVRSAAKPAAARRKASAL